MQTIDRNKLKDMMDKQEDFVLVETLPEEAFRKEHLPGAINIPTGADDFEERFEKLVQDKQRPIVVYCANTDCDASPKAAKKLEKMGYENVMDYEAGKADWKEGGLRVAA